MENKEQADFGKAFAEKKKFQQIESEIKTSRRVHSTAIYREREFLLANYAVELSKGELDIRLSNLTNNYNGFVKENKSLHSQKECESPGRLCCAGGKRLFEMRW